MIRRGYHPGWQLCPDILHQRPQLHLYARILFQQIGQACRPLRLLDGPRPLQIRAPRGGELLLRLRQPLLGQLCFLCIAAPQQPGETAAASLPRIRGSGRDHRVARQRRQRAQRLQHPLTPFAHPSCPNHCMAQPASLAGRDE